MPVEQYLFLSYLIGLIAADPVEPVDLDGKLKLEYYKLQKKFSGAIQLGNMDAQYVPAKQKAFQGKKERTITMIRVLFICHGKSHDR